MFDMGFTEIILIAIVALLFIGPDKLPDTMRTIARTLGKLKRMFDDTKSTITNELHIDELKQEALKYKEELQGAKDSLSSFKNVAASEVSSVKDSVQESIDSGFKNVKSVTYDDFEDDEFFDDKYFQVDDDEDDDFEEKPKLENKKEPKEIAKSKEQKEESKKVKKEKVEKA